MDMLAIILSRAKEKGHIKGVIPNLEENGLPNLQNMQMMTCMVIFIDHGIHANNMKLLLCTFEQLSSLKLTFIKASFSGLDKRKEYEDQYPILCDCKMGTYRFWYLGLSMHYIKLNKKDWKMVEERFEEKKSLAGGKENSYPSG